MRRGKVCQPAFACWFAVLALLWGMTVITAGCSTTDTDPGADLGRWDTSPRGDLAADRARAPDTAPAGDLKIPVRPTDCVPPTAISPSCSGGFCTIPAGCFLMGSLPTETCADSDEVEHWVILSRGLELGQFEVTQQQLKASLGVNPAEGSVNCAQCPATFVSWHLAAAHANAASTAAGLELCYQCSGSGLQVRCATRDTFTGSSSIYQCKGYRLPTEAEWEYSYRAGTHTALYNCQVTACYGEDTGANKIGWYNKNSGGQPRPVGQKQPNAWGLYDMAGNAEEWNHDGNAAYSTAAVTDPVVECGASSSHQARGGSFDVYPKDMRAGDRNAFDGDAAAKTLGFRLARTLPAGGVGLN